MEGGKHVTQVTNENGKEVSGLREGNKAGGRDVALEQTNSAHLYKTKRSIRERVAILN
jgi:hypothetical protein